MKKVFKTKVQDERKIWDRGVLLHFSASLWTASKKVDRDKITRNLPRKLRGMQGLLEDSSLHDEVMGVYNRAHKYLDSETLDYPIKSMRFVDRDRIDIINDRLLEFEEEFEFKAKLLAENREQIMKDYKEALVEEAEKKKFKWQEFFDEKWYPTDIASRFKMKWVFVEISVGNALREVSPQLYKKQVENFKKQWEEFEELTFNCAKGVLIQKIQSIANGNNSVNALENAIAKWDNLWSGYIGEKAFKKVIKDLKKAAKGMTPERLRNNKSYKKEVQEEFGKLATSLDKIDFSPKRAIVF